MADDVINYNSYYCPLLNNILQFAVVFLDRIGILHVHHVLNNYITIGKTFLTANEERFQPTVLACGLTQFTI